MQGLIKEKVLSYSLKESIFFKKNQPFCKNPPNTSTLCEQHLQKWKKISFRISSLTNQLRIVRHVTGTGSGLLGGIPRVVVQISALTLKGPLQVYPPLCDQAKLRYEVSQVWMIATFISQGPQSSVQRSKPEGLRQN